MAALEGGAWALVCGSGMALSTLLLATLQKGSHLVASNRLYGRTTQLLQQELARFGVKAVFVDINDLGQVERALGTPARLLLVETLSNPLLRVADLDGLAGLAGDYSCLLTVDNTFATPVLTRPLQRKADLVMESLTKMIGGHSDRARRGTADVGGQEPTVVETEGWKVAGPGRVSRPRWPGPRPG